MQLDAIIERVWPGREVEVEPLGGGITNQNFKVKVGGETVVLRIGGRNTELLGIDRTAEREATLAAAAAGVGPEVLAFVEPEGYLVTRYIEGRGVPPEEMRRPENVQRTAAALRALHEGRSIHAHFDPFSVVEAYRKTAVAHGVRVPDVYRWAKDVADQIELARGSNALVACHNDLLNANFIDDGERIRIVDWEYAGMGDPFFDLANFSINHEFGPDEDDRLLGAYFGEMRERDRATLRLMRFMSDFREAMWGVVQQGISELDFDFVAYADEHFERLAHTAASPEFRWALEQLEAPR